MPYYHNKNKNLIGPYWIERPHESHSECKEHDECDEHDECNEHDECD